MRVTILSFMKLDASLLLLILFKRSETHPLPFDACDFFNDACPNQLNGVCDDVHLNPRVFDRPECYDGDCYDCDPCHIYSGYCSECIANDCYWCPSDGLCSSERLDQSYFDQFGVTEVGCFTVDSWETSCRDQQPYFCNYSTDTCPFQVDGECDNINFNFLNTNFPECNDGDCYDCDPCHAYRYDCTECIANDCLWCPENSICSSVALDQAYFDRVADNGFTEQRRLLTCATQQSWRSTCAVSVDDTNVFHDPLYDAQLWAYRLMNVEPVWREGITGAGVHIRINDDGVDVNHPEFEGKFDLESSCENYRPVVYWDDHGTGTASIAAGKGGNDLCSVGIAPDATISSCDAFHPETSATELLASGLDRVDVSSNAYGTLSCVPNNRRHLQQCPFRQDTDGSPCSACDFSLATPSEDCETSIISYCLANYENDIDACTEFLNLIVDCNHNTISQEAQDALIRGVTEGRNGDGIVYLFSVGNDYAFGNDVNFEGWLNSRFTISVGAVGRLGKHASYSTSGAAVFICAPGGDSEFLTNNFGATTGGRCNAIGIGTSFACPAAAGAIALILQANPSLGWRDVQGILAATSQKTDPDHSSWTTNAASFHHSYLYGFGIIDAFAAVSAARTWQNYGTEQKISVDSGIVNIALADNPSPAVISVITLNALPTIQEEEQDFFTESVIVSFNLTHSSRGDLNIVLTSPEGTDSILHPGKRPENQQIGNNEVWELMTVRAWGESPIGDWTISLEDQREGDLSTCVDLHWSYVGDFFNNRVIGCATLSLDNFCLDGRISTVLVRSFIDVNGLSAVDACCDCGGGRNSSEVQDILRSWRLDIYGHFSPTSSTTGSPTPLITTTFPTTISTPIPTTPIETPRPTTIDTAPPIPTTTLAPTVDISDRIMMMKIAPQPKCGSLATSQNRGGRGAAAKGCSSGRREKKERRQLLRGA